MIPKLRGAAAAAVLLSMCLPVQAMDFDFDIVDNPSQDDFREVGKDLVALLNGKAMTPPEPGGILGFGIGAFASYVSTDDSQTWQRLTGEDIDSIGLAGIRAEKGLPFGVDVGASYARVPGGGGKLVGGELRYALLEGSVVTPAVGLRGTYTRFSGVDDIDFDSYGADLSISKGFGPLTPYAGVGYVWGRLEADEQFGLADEDLDESRFFVGARATLVVGLTAEYERVGDRDGFNLRVGVAF